MFTPPTPQSTHIFHYDRCDFCIMILAPGAPETDRLKYSREQRFMTAVIRITWCIPTAASAHSDFVGFSVCACFGVTCHPYFWQNDRGLLHATAVTWGWSGHWSGHRLRLRTESWPWRRKFSHRVCREWNSQAFDHESGAPPTELSRPLQEIGRWKHPSSDHKITRLVYDATRLGVANAEMELTFWWEAGAIKGFLFVNLEWVKIWLSMLWLLPGILPFQFLHFCHCFENEVCNDNGSRTYPHISDCSSHCSEN